MPAPTLLEMLAAYPVTSSWTPASLPNLVAWYDATDAATITSSGGAVSAWADKSGNTHTVSQGTAGAKPTTGTTTINSLNTIAFDGGDWLESATLGGLFASAFTIVTVFRKTGANQGFESCPLTIGTSNFGNPFDGYNATRYSGGGAASGSYTSITAMTAPTILTQIGTSGGGTATYSEKINAGTAATGTASTWSNTSSQVFTFGSRADHFTGLLGRVGESVVMSSAIGSPDLTSLLGYLNARWAVY